MGDPGVRRKLCFLMVRETCPTVRNLTPDPLQLTYFRTGILSTSLRSLLRVIPRSQTFANRHRRDCLLLPVRTPAILVHLHSLAILWNSPDDLQL